MSHGLPAAKTGIARLFQLEPAVVRGVLVGITAIIAAVLGKQIDTGWIENILFAYTAVSPIIAGALIRPAVTPNAKERWTVGNIIKRVREETGVVVDLRDGSVVFPNANSKPTDPTE